MKRLALLTVLALVPASMALAQNSLDEEINAELDRMYQQKSSRSVTPSVQVNVQTNPTATSTPYNNQVAGQTSGQTASQTAGQDQATSSNANTVQRAAVTVIESTPLEDSRAEKLRKARQDAEMRTEETMVERLEKSRLDDERRRAEALFGDRYHQLMEQNSAQSAEQKTQQVIINQNNGKQGDIAQPTAAIQAPAQIPAQIPVQAVEPVVVAPAPVQPVQPVPAVIVRSDDMDREEMRRNREREEERDLAERERMRSDIRAQLDAEKKAGEEEVIEQRGYVSGLLGMTEYQDVSNVRGNYSLGVAVGTRMNDRLLVEGSFMYSTFDIEQPDSGPYGYDPVYGRITQMDQYSGTGIVKYQLLGGMIRPVVGGVAGYTYRSFTDTQLAFPNNDASSHAIDLGVMAGADIEVTKTFSIGADFRYMWNVYNRTDNSGFQSRFSQQIMNSGTPIEEISYMTFSVVGRASF